MCGLDCQLTGTACAPSSAAQVYCRYVSQHHPLNCPAASARYHSDYRDVAGDDRANACGHNNGEGGGAAGCDAFNHFTNYGRNEGMFCFSAAISPRALSR